MITIALSTRVAESLNRYATATSQNRDEAGNELLSWALAVLDRVAEHEAATPTPKSRPAPMLRQECADDDDAVLRFVRGLAIEGVLLTRTALRMHSSRPIPEKRTSAALERLIESGRLWLQDGRVALREEEPF